MSINLTATQLFFSILTVGGIVLLIILSIRYYLKKKGNSDLKEFHSSDDRYTALKNRTKYPEVNGLSYSQLSFQIGLAISMLLIGLVFSYSTTFNESSIVSTVEDGEVLEIDEVPRTPKKEKKKIENPRIEEVDDSEDVEEKEIVKNLKPREIQSTDSEIGLESDQNEASESKAMPLPERKDKSSEEKIFARAEKMPVFPSCDTIEGTNKMKYQCTQSQLLRYIYNNIDYPEIAKDAEIEGTVYISFVISSNGNIENIKILRSMNDDLGGEALRVIQKMKDEIRNWVPGKQRGNSVSVRFKIQIKFNLE